MTYSNNYRCCGAMRSTRNREPMRTCFCRRDQLTSSRKPPLPWPGRHSHCRHLSRGNELLSASSLPRFRHFLGNETELWQDHHPIGKKWYEMVRHVQKHVSVRHLGTCQV